MKSEETKGIVIKPGVSGVGKSEGETKMKNELFLDLTSYRDTGRYNVITHAWDNIAGWHYAFVASFETEEEAEAFIETNEK